MRIIFLLPLCLAISAPAPASALDAKGQAKIEKQDAAYLIKLNKDLDKEYKGQNKKISLTHCDHTTTLDVKSGFAYTFFHEFTNTTEKDIFINSKIISFFDAKGRFFTANTGVLDPGGPWDWTPELRANKYKIAPGQTMRIMQTQPDWKWKVTVKPSGDKPGFTMQYLVGYDTTNTENNTNDDTLDAHCVHYRVE